MKHHTHRVDTTIIRPFLGSVAAPPKPEAHGNICQIDRCKCGATRRTNINGQYSERGKWLAAINRVDNC